MVCGPAGLLGVAPGGFAGAAAAVAVMTMRRATTASTRDLIDPRIGRRACDDDTVQQRVEATPASGSCHDADRTALSSLGVSPAAQRGYEVLLTRSPATVEDLAVA